MSFLIVCPNRNPLPWVRALKAQAPDLEVEVYPEVTHPERVEFILSWRHPHGIFNQFPNARVIASMGAGIDHIIEDPDIPPHIQITRIVDPKLSKDMSFFVLALVLEHMRNLTSHHCATQWEPRIYRRPEDVRIGIMGMGILGSSVAELLVRNEFRVHGWRRSSTGMMEIPEYYGESGLGEFLEGTDILICLLPLTPATENILDRDLFLRLPKGAYLINVARGRHLVEEDLLEMIHNGHISGASLDVFREEPLPEDHAFRKNDRIRITPHIASVTHPASVVPQLLQNYKNRAGDNLEHLVSRETFY